MIYGCPSLLKEVEAALYQCSVAIERITAMQQPVILKEGGIAWLQVHIGQQSSAHYLILQEFVQLFAHLLHLCRVIFHYTVVVPVQLYAPCIAVYYLTALALV